MARFDTSQLDASQYGGVQGFFHEPSQYQYVLAKRDRIVDEVRDVMVFGYAGADGIEFVLRPNDPTVYAFHPIDGRFDQLAPDFDTFIAGWLSGSIRV